MVCKAVTGISHIINGFAYCLCMCENVRVFALQLFAIHFTKFTFCFCFTFECTWEYAELERNPISLSLAPLASLYHSASLRWSAAITNIRTNVCIFVGIVCADCLFVWYLPRLHKNETLIERQR